MTDTLPLAAEFPHADRDAWRKLVDGALKGAPFEKLVGKTYDGLAIEPIYPRAANAAIIAGRAPAAPWTVMQRIDHPDATLANAQALHDLENGATGLALVFAGAASAYGFGLAPSPAAIERLLDGIHLDAGITVDVQIGPQSRMAAIHIAELIQRRGSKTTDCNICFGLDPIGAAAVVGASPYAWSEIAPAVASGAKGLAGIGFTHRLIASDGRVVHNAGGSEAQELAFVLASGVAYLRALEHAGVALDAARDMIYARLSADADQFLTMAKFRALRLLWARVEEACGLAPKPLFVAGETAWRMLTKRDANVNMLRATIATFAAGLAGANAITVLPHALAIGLPDAFARRVARNTHLVLLEESSLAGVTDPAAGSGGIEALTRELCEAGWAQFQDIEKAGGAFEALAKGVLQSRVTATQRVRAANIGKRREVLTGASEFPNLRETSPAVLDATPVVLPPYGEAKISFAALKPLRVAMPFEALRDKSDAILAATNARPKVLLVTLGTPTDFTARVGFARSLFESGGIEAVETAADDVSAEQASGAALACLCSSDKIYAEKAAEAAKTLRAAGLRHIYIAGRPGDQEAAFRAAGIDDFIFAGSDVVATLGTAYDRVAMP